MKKSNKIGYIFSFIFGAVLFGSISAVVATGIYSSSVEYLTATNSNVQNISDALDDLYSKTWKAKYYEDNNYIDLRWTNANGTGGAISFVYWNDGFSSTNYTKTNVPSVTYNTRDLFIEWYGLNNFQSKPIFIKTTKIDGIVVGHVACLWNNNKEFCLSPNYWTGTIGVADETEGLNTKEKLKEDMENALSITLYNSSSEATSAGHTGYYCGSISTRSFCELGNIGCSAYSDGTVYCYLTNNSEYCNTYTIGTARCGIS